MQPKDYKHYLRFYSGGVWHYYYVSGTSVLNTTTKTELSYAPEGWQDYEIIFERGFTYHGLFTAFTTPLKFVKDGAMILRYLKYTFGIESSVELYVERLDRSDWTYSQFFKAEVDMSKSQDEFDYLIAPVIEGGFIEKLKSRENTPYSFALEQNADREWLEHDGIELQAKLSFSNGTHTAVEMPANGFDEFPLWGYYDTEGTNVYQVFYDVSLTPSVQKQVVRNNSGASIDYQITIQGVYVISTNVSFGGNGYLTIRVIEYDTNGVFVAVHDLWTTSSPIVGAGVSTGNTYTVNIDQTVTIGSGNQIAVTHILAGGPLGSSDPSPAYTNGAWATTSVVADLGVYFVNRFDPTYIPIIPAYDMLSQLLKELADDSSLTVTSTLLTTTLNNEHYITSGDGVRSLTNSTISMTWADFYKWANSKFGAMFYYDRATNTAYLEAKATAYDPNINPDYPTIDSVVNFKCIPFTEEAFTNLKIGSQNFNYDQKGADDNEVTNGKDEFNNTNEYRTVMTRLNGATKDYVSPFRDDIHGIELVRINLSGKELADASSDNEVFVLHCDPSTAGTSFEWFNPIAAAYQTQSTITLFRTPIDPTPGASYWQINNIFSPETAYNIFYSSARCVYRNGNYFRSLFKLNDADDFQFQRNGKTGDRMYTEEGATPDIVNESADIGIMDLCANDAVLFQPFIFEITTRDDVNLYDIINDNPFNFITFTFKDETYSGFIIKASTKPTWRGVTTFRLLATADTDMTNLIRIA